MDTSLLSCEFPAAESRVSTASDCKLSPSKTTFRLTTRSPLSTSSNPPALLTAHELLQEEKPLANRKPASCDRRVVDDTGIILPPTPAEVAEAELAAEEQRTARRRRSSSSRLFGSWTTRRSNSPKTSPQQFRSAATYRAPEDTANLEVDPGHLNSRVVTPPTSWQTHRIDNSLQPVRSSLSSKEPSHLTPDTSKYGALKGCLPKSSRPWKSNYLPDFTVTLESSKLSQSPISSPPPHRTSTSYPDHQKKRSTAMEPIRSGILKHWTGRLGRWKERTFSLYPGLLTYTKGGSDKQRATIPLFGALVEKVNKDPQGFTIKFAGEKIQLKANTEEERSRWIMDITAVKGTAQIPDARLLCHDDTMIESTETDPIGLPYMGTSTSYQMDEAMPMARSDCSSAAGGPRPPVKRLHECNEKFRSDMEISFADQDALLQRLLSMIALLKDSGQNTLIQSLIQQVQHVLTEHERAKALTTAHTATMGRLIDEEKANCKLLQKTVKKMGRENYKLMEHMRGSNDQSQSFVKSVKGVNLSEAIVTHSGEAGTHTSEQPIPLNESSRPAKSEGPVVSEVTEEFFDVDDEIGRSPPAEEETELESRRDFSSSLSDSSGHTSSSTSSFGARPPLENEFLTDSPERIEVVETLDRLSSKTLTLGLPRYPDNETRTILPVARTDCKVSLWNLLKDCVGKDLSRISLPVFFNEPTSFLQRMAEDFQYADLLEKAALSSDPMERLMLVSVFTVTPFASADGRTYKPFNPLLGETYEIIHRGYRFMSEQVGHHPPVTSWHCNGAGFESYGHISLNTKFTGKSLEVNLQGPYNIVIGHPNGYQEYYSFAKPRMVLTNLIFGTISLELGGTYAVTNHTTGDYAIIDFPKKGWWSSELHHHVRGVVVSREGTPAYRLSGKWSSVLMAMKVDACKSCALRANYPLEVPIAENIIYPRKPLDATIPWSEISVDSPAMFVWEVEPRPSYAANFYEFGYMTMELNHLSSLYDPKAGAMIPPTDSRFRPDQRALENGEVEESNGHKIRLEDKQRSATRKLPKGEMDHNCAWYQRYKDLVLNCDSWKFDSQYWLARDEGNDTLFRERCPDIF